MSLIHNYNWDSWQGSLLAELEPLGRTVDTEARELLEHDLSIGKHNVAKHMTNSREGFDTVHLTSILLCSYDKKIYLCRPLLDFFIFQNQEFSFLNARFWTWLRHSRVSIHRECLAILDFQIWVILKVEVKMNGVFIFDSWKFTISWRLKIYHRLHFKKNNLNGILCVLSIKFELIFYWYLAVVRLICHVNPCQTIFWG